MPLTQAGPLAALVTLAALAAGGCAVKAEETGPVLRSPAARRGMEITAEGPAVVVAAGECEIGGRVVQVAGPTALPVPPAPILEVKDESLRLSVDKPAGWAKGTRLKGCNARDVNAFGAFVKGSLTLRRGPGGEVLKEDEDYLVDADWGHVGLGPSGRATAQEAVAASYRYSLMRMDTVQVSPEGKVSLKSGEAHVSAPVPPDADAGCVALAHVWVPHQATTVRPEGIWVIAETAAQAVTGSTPGRIPKTLAKLRAGGPVKVVCWGDSVTAGGNASVPEKNYVNVFAAGLRERFPNARIEVENVSVGGSNSSQWLYPERARFRNLPPEETPCKFQRILDAKPDLVTIEFVNDAGLNAQTLGPVYDDILQRLHGIGAEVIFITPHFTMLRMMGFSDVREVEKRPYVLALRDYAEKHGIALADASARWQHLWKEGLPYLTLLHNTINHPDDRGHRLFAEELWKCFR